MKGQPERRLFTTFANDLIMRPNDLELVSIVDTPEAVLEVLRRAC